MAGQSKTAKKLKSLRELSGLSVRETAAALGMKSASSYSYYEDDFKKKFIPADLARGLVGVFGPKGVGADEIMVLAGLGEDSVHTFNTSDLPGHTPEREIVEVPEYDIRAGMGEGFVIDRETIKDTWTFSRRYLSEELRLALRDLVVIEVVGDSMEPTLRSGDRVLVDMSDRRIGTPGIFVLWDGDGTVAKRLDLIPGSEPRKMLRISDNPLHPPREVLVEETNIVGRIVWFARRL